MAFGFMAQNGLNIVTKRAEDRNYAKKWGTQRPKGGQRKKTPNIFGHIVPKEVDVAICRSSDLHFSKI